MIGYVPHLYVPTVSSGCGKCGVGPGAFHHNSHEVRRYELKGKDMKTIQIEVSEARSLEHAMDRAIEDAGNRCFSSHPKGEDHRETHTVTKVTFKTLEATIGYGHRDNRFTYKFEAELAEC